MVCSDEGSQPNGKQRISAIDSPGGDTYTPSSGIWQTVWLEKAPTQYIQDLIINQANLESVTVTTSVSSTGPIADVNYKVLDNGVTVATVSGKAGEAVRIEIPIPKLWSTSSPFLYDLVVSTSTDSVVSYFGLRTFELGDGPKGQRPLLNGNYTFMVGFLDQSWWPDGQCTDTVSVAATITITITITVNVTVNVTTTFIGLVFNG